MTEDNTNVATGQAHRDPPPAAQSHMDAQASAEGDLRGVSSATGRIDGIPLDRLWIASGRVPYNDDHSTILVEATTAQEAWDRLEDLLYEDEEEGVMEMNEKEFGQAIFVYTLTPLVLAPVRQKAPS